MKQMRLHYIVCKVLQREAYYCAAKSKNVVDITIMPQGLHNEPAKLTTEVQEKLKITHDVQGRPYDAAILGYALCSNGIVGLKADIPIIVPRGHDCMTILLGSKEKYKDYFDSHRGIYWYSPGWIESNLMPSQERYELTLKEYTEKYGKDNAEYLMEAEQTWLKEYAWATFIDWPMFENQKNKDYTKTCADFLKWSYDEVKGDPSYIQRLLNGQWDNQEFLVVKPGQRIAADITNPGIITAE